MSNEQQGLEAHKLPYGLSSVCCLSHKSEFMMDFPMLLFPLHHSTKVLNNCTALEYDTNREFIFIHGCISVHVCLVSLSVAGGLKDVHGRLSVPAGSVCPLL